MAVGLYAALLGILLIVLSLRVIALRGSPAFIWFSLETRERYLYNVLFVDTET